MSYNNKNQGIWMNKDKSKKVFYRMSIGEKVTHPSEFELVESYSSVNAINKGRLLIKEGYEETFLSELKKPKKLVSFGN